MNLSHENSMEKSSKTLLNGGWIVEQLARFKIIVCFRACRWQHLPAHAELMSAEGSAMSSEMDSVRSDAWE